MVKASFYVKRVVIQREIHFNWNGKKGILIHVVDDDDDSLTCIDKYEVLPEDKFSDEEKGKIQKNYLYLLFTGNLNESGDERDIDIEDNNPDNEIS